MNPESMDARTDARVRAAIAMIGACTAATASYAVLRVGQWLVFTEPNPALVIYSEHAAYFWRSWIAAYVGVLVGFTVWVLAARAPERVARALAHGVVVVTALLVLQSLLVP